MYISEKLKDNSNIQNSNNFNDFLSQKKLDVIQNLDSQNKSSHNNNRSYKYYSNDKYRNKNNYFSNNKSVQNSDRQIEMIESGVSRKILSPNGYFQNEYNNNHNQNYNQDLNLNQYLEQRKQPTKNDQSSKLGPKDLKYALQREQVQHLAEVFITLNCFEDITEYERNDEIDPMDFINQNIYKLPAQSRTQIKHSFKRIQLQQIQPHKPSDYMSEMFK
ncbi:hypothetical protein PPERSA_02727 [Pseudocohnilembus persalinus]|uniref:Uncharacterized protein n=1 Tax=Pseudocohnilembus persalinus TaxID=266149 RepID=A0A0V0R5T6_PSEPJ|nr:hypothetical protein PPERSA_02727 [Pseudocohnilembus persalinus]|eukprot:KRX09855.1 hypothetical protein PPERSA_02727 [Pseudocohnilembus persalinus]